ncbi:hypothetical protein CBOM_02140 [Ceraceosorus bombacis]|uniref:Uncharacterized protein n=1 Tax=Ceraceosorus bombacis TaxID=401625 RepID=A0A0P1BEC2_9BASI|nr:hypothetical protein CBOM_02140 [Ceraceosorus bombacis]
MDLVELSSCEVREPRLGPVDLPPLEDFGWYSGCASNPNFSIPRTPLDMDQACMWGKNNAMGLSGLNVENERLKEGLNATLAQWPFSAPSFEHQAGLATGLARGQSGGLGLSLVA